jgi:hypothetical protein
LPKEDCWKQSRILQNILDSQIRSQISKRASC